MRILRYFRPTWRNFLTLLVLLPALWLLASWFVVHKLTSRPHPWFAEPAPIVSWGTLEEHRLHTSDGESLGAWFHRGTSDGLSVLVLHGNRGCRHNSLPAVEFFAEQGGSVLMISLRAHGDSSGEVNDIGFSARRDVIAAVEFLEKERPGRPIVVNGTSMGAAAAIFAAGDLRERVRGYVLESPYLDLHQAVRNRTEVFLPPILDQVAYGGIALVGPLVLPYVDDIAPIKYVENIPSSVPVLFLSGTRDDRARPFEVQALYDRIADHAHLVFIEGAKHGCLIRADQQRYTEAVTPFLREVASGWRIVRGRLSCRFRSFLAAASASAVG